MTPQQFYEKWIKIEKENYVKKQDGSNTPGQRKKDFLEMMKNMNVEIKELTLYNGKMIKNGTAYERDGHIVPINMEIVKRLRFDTEAQLINCIDTMSKNEWDRFIKK